MLVTAKNISLDFVSAFVSKNRVPIEERLGKLIPEKRISRLKKQVGFEAFSIVDKEICTSDLCFAAAEKIFAETNTSRE